MNSVSLRLKAPWFCIVAAATIFAPPLGYADTTVNYRIGIVGSGFMSIANLTGTSTTKIAGDRARVDSEIQMQSALMRTLARNAGSSVQITRLDQDKLFQINDKKKTYTETTFAEEREQLNKAMQSLQKSQTSQQSATTGVDEAQCEWLDPKIEIKRTGEKANIAGYNTERLIIGSTQQCKLKKSNQICEFGISLDQWLAPTFEGAAELQAYERAYAQKMGITATGSREFAERAQSYFGRYKDMMAQLASQSGEIKGYPIKSTIALGVGGALCKSAENAGKNAPPNVNELMGGLLGTKKSTPQSTSLPATTPTGLTPVITISNELLSVAKTAVDPQLFEIPSGYKRVSK